MTSIVCEEGMEKMGKRLNFWTHDNRFLKGLVDSMVERLQFKEIYGDVTRGQENVCLLYTSDAADETSTV